MAVPLDSSSFARTLTATNGADLVATPAKFGAGSLRCAGTGGTATTGYGITAPTSTDFDLGAGQFTVECWAYFNTAQATSGFVGRYSSTAANAQFLLFSSSGSLIFRFLHASGTRDTTATWTPVAGQWYHLAADRNAAGVVRLYVDGVVQASNTFVEAWKPVTATVQIGFVGGFADTFQMDGYLDEVRVSNTARYAGAFTPSASAFASDANTLLLVHADDAGHAARVSQAVVEVARTNLAPTARVSQAAIEVARTNLAPKARVSQSVIEVVRQSAPGALLVSQAVVEVLRNNTAVNLQVSQAVVEVLRTGLVNVQLSQALLEVLRTNGVESTGVLPLTLVINT